jgi:large subunit ribosomal protein L4
MKASKLPINAFWLDVFEGPFTVPQSEGTVSPLRKIYLSEEVFRTDVRPDLMARVVRWQRNKAMQGTHKTKGKGEVSGTGKKPWGQKGTGRARQGSLRNPHFRGGGVAFGSTPRDHEHKLNKKERRLGLRSALAARLQEGKLFIVDSLKPRKEKENNNNEATATDEEVFVKTRQMADYCEKLQLNSVVVVDDVQRESLVRACRNARHIHYLPQVGLNVYAILRAKQVLLTVNALRILEHRLSETRQRDRRYAKRGWTPEDTAEKERRDMEQRENTPATEEPRRLTRIEQQREIYRASQKTKRAGPKVNAEEVA